MKHIYTHDNILVLHSVKNILAMNDIECFVKDEHSIPMGARNGIENTFHELWIMRDRDFDKATALIEREVENPDTGASWKCSVCGEENAGSFDMCWNCQNDRGDL